MREPSSSEREVALVAHRRELVVRAPELPLGRLPVAADHLDEVPEAFATAHRGAREVAEDLAIRDALEDHLARRLALSEHAPKLTEEAEGIRFCAAMAAHPLEDLRSLGQGPGRGRRPEGERDDDPDQVIVRVVRILGPQVELVGAIGGLTHALELAKPVSGPAHDAPGTCRAEVVTIGLAERGEGEALGFELRVVDVRVDLEAQSQLREVGSDAGALVARAIGELDRLGEGSIRLVEAAGPQERIAEIAEKLGTPRVVSRP